MEVHTKRHTRLLELLRRFPSQREFADAAELAVAHVSQMVTGRREMGERVARRIEEQLSLPSGWMDEPHHTDDGQDAAEVDAPAQTSHYTAEERALVESYRIADQAHRDIARRVLAISPPQRGLTLSGPTLGERPAKTLSHAVTLGGPVPPTDTDRSESGTS